MIAKIDSAQGRHIYSKRLGIVEPVFGNIRENKNLRRFSLRGMIHNIEKIKNYGIAYERSIDEVSVEFHSLMVITNKKQLRFD